MQSSLKLRIIPVLTFNGFALVKTKQFSNPRMVGNPVQTARLYNSRGVDELVFLDIYASEQDRNINLKLVSDVIKECFMPVSIGGGIKSLEDINNLLKIGADKVVIKTLALINTNLIKDAVRFFGSQCISIAVDVMVKNGQYVINTGAKIDECNLSEFIKSMEDCDVGEYLLCSTDNDGMMNGFDINLVNHVSELTNKPIIAIGGAGKPEHFVTLFETTNIEAAASSSIYHFTQYTPQDVKNSLNKRGFNVRI